MSAHIWIPIFGGLLCGALSVIVIQAISLRRYARWRRAILIYIESGCRIWCFDNRIRS